MATRTRLPPSTLELTRWIDKAASHGALHKNTAGRKKSRAARLVAGDVAA